jgi:type IV pilus assembly protein PilM
MKVDAVRRVLDASGISVRSSITSVSGESVIVRYIQLPDMPEEELKSALRWEAEEYIPFRIEDVNLDSVILGHSEQAGVGKIDVLLISAKKELVDQHLDILREAGLTPAIVDVDSFAFLNCFEVNHEPGSQEVVALVNIGAGVTNINIYVAGVSRFSRDISIAGDTITSAIRSRLDVSMAQAEEMKIAEGAPAPEVDATAEAGADSSLLDTIRGAVEEMAGHTIGDSTPEAIAAKAVHNTLQNLISEIRRSIQFFENQSGGKIVQKIVLGGGTARMKNLPSFISKELNLPTEIINPLQRISPSGPGLDQTLLNSSREFLGVGIGLALRGVME